jgi:hypothetical protein
MFLPLPPHIRSLPKLQSIGVLSVFHSSLRLLPVLLAAAALTCSCTIISQSPLARLECALPALDGTREIIAADSGEIPYQRWTLPDWNEDLRYVWMVGNYDFRKHKSVEIILFFHGMHSKDYYDAFRRELEQLASKRPDKPFLFVGFVDSPYINPAIRGRERWTAISPREGERPERLFSSINRVFTSFRKIFPNLKKDQTSITLAGFSGGGKVLNSVGNWLARSSGDDPYAEVFRTRLTKIVYFDCWFEKDIVNTIPVLLESNPAIKIVGTVHMKKPVENAAMLVGKYKMRADKTNRQLATMDGRLIIFKNDSHWDAMISRLKEAL